MVIPGTSADMPAPHRLPAGDAHRGRAFVQVEDELDPIECRVTWCDPATARSLAKANAHLRPSFDLGEFSAAEGAPTSSYDRAVPVEDELILGLLEAGEQSYQAVAEAVGITADAARKRLTRLEQAGRVQHASGSPMWALT